MTVQENGSRNKTVTLESTNLRQVKEKTGKKKFVMMCKALSLNNQKSELKMLLHLLTFPPPLTVAPCMYMLTSYNVSFLLDCCGEATYKTTTTISYWNTLLSLCIP